MSDAERDNVALLEEGIAAYNRGDLSFVIERAAEDIEVHAVGELVNAGTYHGRDEFSRWMMSWQEAWSEISLEVRGVEAIDERFLLVDVWQRAVGAESGVPVEMGIFQLIEARNGELARFHLYASRDQALAALERLGAAASD